MFDTLRALSPRTRTTVLAGLASLSGAALGTAIATPPDLAERAEATPTQARQVARQPGDPPTPDLGRKAYVDGIMARNIFDAKSIGRASAPTAADALQRGEELDWHLIGVVYAEREELSSALVRRERGSARMVVLGERLDGLVITEIKATRLVLESRDGQRTVLELPDFDEVEIRDHRPPGAGPGVFRVDKHHFQIDSQTVDKVLSSTRGLRKLGRARPHKRRGKVIGYRLSRIRGGSLGRKIGLRSGDIITAINGRELRSTQDAIATYKALKDASSLKLEVQRRRGRNKRSIRVDIL